MAFLERTLMGLKLVLGKFDIDLGRHLSIKQELPNTDHVTSIVSLIQLLHDLDYDIKLVYENGYKIKSSKLNWEITAVIGEARIGKLVIHQNMKLEIDIENKIAAIKHCINAPHDAPFTNQEWLYFVGFYNILSTLYNEEGITNVLFADYSKYMPYFMLAEEQIAEVKTYAK